MAIVAAGAMAFAAPAWAATYTVGTTSDTNANGCASPPAGLCTLRQLIGSVAPNDTIMVPPGTYMLTQGALSVTRNMTIAGAGARSTVIQQTTTTATSRTIEIVPPANGGPAPTVSISGLTIENGKADLTNGSFGGDILNQGTLTLSEDLITFGQAQSGGGISNDRGTLTVTHSLVYSNTANSGGADSGGIQNYGDSTASGKLTVDNSTIAGNTSQLGGGIYSWCGATCSNTTTVVNSTIAHNDGGSRSASGGGLLADAGTISVQNSIVAFNTVTPATGGGSTPSNCGPAGITSLGHNIETATDCGFKTSSDLAGTDPQFITAFPVDNGGNTNTLAFKGTSPAVDAIPWHSAGCSGTDQRDISRPQGTGCDIGAFEMLQPVVGVQFTAVLGQVVAHAGTTPSIGWGDGTSSSSVYSTSTREVTGTHAYAATGLYHGLINYVNIDGAPSHALFDLKVQGALSPTAVPVATAAGTPFSGQVATFADATPNAAAGDFTATVTWGDGTSSAGTVTAAPGGFAVGGSHTYAGGGSYPTQITVTDIGGSTGAATGTATVTARPVAVTGAPSVQGSTTAGFSGQVNPNGLPTTAHFEYGLDAKYQLTPTGQLYTASTPEQPVGSDLTTHNVSTTVKGLVPNALYHVRLVADNGAGITDGPDQTFMTATDPKPAPPTLGKTFDVAPAGGLVFIKLPGTHAAADGITKGAGFIPLTEARQLPPGTQVDARQGALKLIAAAASSQHIGKTQSVIFSSGLFKIGSQVRNGIEKGLTTISLQEDLFPGAPSYKSCTAHAASDVFGHAAISRSILQTLHASGHGRFRTRGRYSAGTVRGTIWDTTDRCDGTLTTVHRGTVDVLDLRLRKTIQVHAHHSYLAKAPVKKRK